METKEAKTDIIFEGEKSPTDQELDTKENHENGDGNSSSNEEEVQKKENYEEIQNDDEAQGPTNQAETKMETKEAETDIIFEGEKSATDHELDTKENHENGDGNSSSNEEEVQKKESYEEIQNDDEAQGPTNQSILEKIKTYIDHVVTKINTDIDHLVTKMQRMEEEMKSYHKEICKKKRKNKFKKKSKKDNKEARLEEIKGISDLLKKRDIREENKSDDKLDTRLNKMREKYEEDEYKWEEEKKNLAAKLRMATESYEFYYALFQDSELKINELINELHCATERAQLYRGILHNLDL